jgi:multiple sugar transport system ATP-binding protein
MAEIRLEGITKRFGQTTAVADLDLTVRDGEFVVLLGPTGAGKTTTLRVVAGLERPETGRVHIGGEDATRFGPAERDVAFVFQQYSLYPHYTVFENLAFPLKAPRRRLPKGEIEATVREVARMLRIDHKLGNRATQLSGGEMQRVAIGRALVRKPSVYLMDEPLSSLDAKLRAELRVELKRIQSELGATILYVTHDQIEAMTLADRVGVLREGRLVQVGTPRQVYGDPHSIYVAQRLGSPTINLVTPAQLGVDALAPAVATLGLRPEDVHVGAGGRQARILQLEPLGAETVVRLQLGELELLALAPQGRSLRKGESVPVGFQTEALLHFDAAGQRLGRGGERHVA